MYANPDNLKFASMRSALINEILFCQSDDEIRQLIETAVRNIEQSCPGGSPVLSFIEGCLQDLAAFSPMHEEALQWNNIKMARICFFRHKQKNENVQA